MLFFVARIKKVYNETFVLWNGCGKVAKNTVIHEVLHIIHNFLDFRKRLDKTKKYKK